MWYTGLQVQIWTYQQFAETLTATCDSGNWAGHICFIPDCIQATPCTNCCLTNKRPGKLTCLMKCFLYWQLSEPINTQLWLMPPPPHVYMLILWPILVFWLQWLKMMESKVTLMKSSPGACGWHQRHGRSHTVPSL